MRSMLIRAIDLLMIALTLFAGPYRVIAYKFLTFGGIGLGLVTWIGIAVVYPVCAFPAGRDRQPWAIGLWLALIVWAYVQMFAKWCATQRRNPRLPHCWLGRGEWFFALAFTLAVTAFAGNGAGLFFFAGFWCSTAQLWLLACSGPGAALQAAWRFWRGRSAARAAAAATAQAKPTTFTGRVGSFLVGHAIWSILIGWLSLSVVFKTIGLILSIPAAILLWMLGGHAELPQFAQDDARSFVSRAEEALGDKRDEAMERLRQKKREKWEQHRDEISDEARRAGRHAAWKFFTR